MRAPSAIPDRRPSCFPVVSCPHEHRTLFVFCRAMHHCVRLSIGDLVAETARSARRASRVYGSHVLMLLLTFYS